MSADLTADVVIVGSGVAGALVAWKLASTGAKVVVLEAGPRIDRMAAVETFRKALVKTPDSPYPTNEWAPRPVVSDPDGYLVQAGPEKFTGVYERIVGGTTWHWLGTALRFLPSDFEMKTRYQVGVDWPLQYKDLEPWYNAAEQAMGVSGDSNKPYGSFRSKPYPNGPLRPSYLDQVVARAVKSLKITVDVLPQARNSVPYDERPACCGNANCVPLCPIGAKYDGGVHVGKAEAAGARLVENAVAYQVEVDEQGQISGVRFRHPDKTEGRATGRIYVLACHAIETPKLLLISRTDKLPQGVANSSDQVGRNLMGNPVLAGWALAKEPVWPFRSPLTSGCIQTYRDGPGRSQASAFWIAIGNSGWPNGSPIALTPQFIAKGLRGKALQQALIDHTSRQVKLAAPAEQLPDPENRIVPDFDQLDALGIARPKVSYRIGDYVHKGLDKAHTLMKKIFGAMQATEVQFGERLADPAHILGTYRCGHDPKSSVVNARLQSHDHKNLYLLGAGVYPTVGTATPTLTIAALALRAAEAIGEDLKK